MVKSFVEKEHTSDDGTMSYAAYSPCGLYRYLLKRFWKESKPPMVFIMLNPSTATEEVNDPTVERCCQRARAEGYGGVVVLNLFAFRATNPSRLYVVEDPVGPMNDYFFDKCISFFHMVGAPIICAWGAHGAHEGRDKVALRYCREWSVKPLALGLTKHGQPRHPLYLPYEAKTFAFLTDKGEVVDPRAGTPEGLAG